MEAQEQTRTQLSTILDQLGPGMWLRVDDRFLSAAFGKKDKSTEAERFAKDNNCSFQYETGHAHGDGTGVFGRAYTKEPSNG